MLKPLDNITNGGDPRVRTILDELGVQFDCNNGIFSFAFSDDNNRNIYFYIISQTYFFGNAEMRRIDVRCDDQTAWTPELIKMLLFQNEGLNIGSWGLMDTPQGVPIAVLGIRFSATADSNMLSAIIESAMVVTQHTYAVLVPNTLQQSRNTVLPDRG